MSDFYEIISNFLEELRCDSAEREYVIAPKDVEKAERELAKKNKEYTEYLRELPLSQRAFLEEYMDVLNHAYFKEEQRAYYQGLMDAVQFLGELNLLKSSKNMDRLITKLQS